MKTQGDKNHAFIMAAAEKRMRGEWDLSWDEKMPKEWRDQWDKDIKARQAGDAAQQDQHQEPKQPFGLTPEMIKKTIDRKPGDAPVRLPRGGSREEIEANLGAAGVPKKEEL